MGGSKDMTKMLDEAFWRHLKPTVRECKDMDLEKDGMCLYIKSSMKRLFFPEEALY